MKYKIKNHIIDAKSPVEALKIHKMLDSLKDSYYIVACEKGDFWFDENGKPNEFKKAKRFKSYQEADSWRRSKGEGSVQEINDSVKDDDIDYLSQEEEKAIEDYKKAISNTKDVKLLKLFAHILKEETEHLEELQSEEIEDSCKDSENYIIYKIGSNIYGTNEDNYNSKIQNEREIQNFTKSGFKNVEEVVEYMKKYGHVPGQIIVK